MSPRTGRPKLDNPRSEIVRFRVTVDELSAIAAAATAAGQSVADYARSKVIVTKPKRRRGHDAPPAAG